MTDIFNKFFPEGTPDTEKQDIENTYKSYKNYKLPLKNASGDSLDYNIICPNIKNIGTDVAQSGGEIFTDCNSNVNKKYKALRDEFIKERYERCSKLAGPTQEECKKTDMSLLNINMQIQGDDYDMMMMEYKDPNDNIFDNQESLKLHMNKIDYQNIANTYAKNVESLRDKLVAKLEELIIAYENMYNIFKGNEKKGVGQVTDLQTKIKNLLIVNKDYTLKDKKKQHEISNINLRLSGKYNEISSTLELYKPLIWYLYWILFVVLIAVMIYKKTWSNITSYAFVFTLLFVPTLIMNPLIRLILSKIKNEKLDGITVAFTAFVLLLLSLLFFTNRFALNNLKGASGSTPKTPSPTPVSPSPTPKTPSPTPKTPTVLKKN